jgi:hypothetical protein
MPAMEKTMEIPAYRAKQYINLHPKEIAERRIMIQKLEAKLFSYKDAIALIEQEIFKTQQAINAHKTIVGE